jgi:hypothetical protein
MRKIIASAAGLLAFAGLTSVAYADVSGTVWQGNAAASADARVESLPMGAPFNGSLIHGSLGAVVATFTGPNNLNYFLNVPNVPPGGTIGQFVANGGGVCSGSCGTTLQDTIFAILGNDFFSPGQTFFALHDDGMSFYINGQTIFSSPGPTPVNNPPNSPSTGTFSGFPAGFYNFEVVYGENNGLPAVLTMAVPGPIVGAGLPGLLAACGGLLALARRRRREQIA